MFDYSAASSQAALEYKLYLLNNAMDEDDISTRIRLKSKDSDRFINMRDVYSTNTESKEPFPGRRAGEREERSCVEIAVGVFGVVDGVMGASRRTAVTGCGLIRMQQLFDALAAADYVLKINVIRVGDVDDALDKLKSVDRRRIDEDKRILLDMPIRDAEEFLSRQVCYQLLD
ncbi:hypothetical protein LSH36_648g00038 [Paralvinella palmiformis]|uniref:Uncharacterized protein n=1 Tax=Paralvinella palmiformis TaxID=53620 RepID=A0AAD9J5A9_9ANNE|nr:hypothetical protein LSH36_648g00038 [Paralvinella palmiformis]